MDDTLVYRTISRTSYYERVLDTAGLRFSERSTRRAIQATLKWEKHNFNALDRSNPIKIRMLFTTLLQKLGVDVNDALISRLQRIRESETAWALYADVKPFLATLRRRGMKTVIVTNRPRWALDRDLNGFGLKPYLDLAVCPEDAQARGGKRDTKMWHYALRRMKLKANEVLHVGDNHTEDIIVPKSVGLSVIRIQRQHYDQNSSHTTIH
jgi:HAD superfamily hydrolase (TIGR01549 family)